MNYRILKCLKGWSHALGISRYQSSNKHTSISFPSQPKYSRTILMTSKAVSIAFTTNLNANRTEEEENDQPNISTAWPGEFFKHFVVTDMHVQLTNQSSAFTTVNQSDLRAAGLNTRMWKANQTFFASTARETISDFEPRARDFLVENYVTRTLWLL